VKELTPFIAAMDGLAEGMVTVGELYQKREYFVPELLICTDALSVDHKNNIGESRRLLGSDVLLFGDIDGFNVLTLGTTDDVNAAVKAAIESGVNAVWPGCDIWSAVPEENMIALVEAVLKYGQLD